MDIIEYYKSLNPAEQELLKLKSGLPKDTFYQVVTGRRNATFKTGAALGRADKNITWTMLRPEVQFPPHMA